LRKQRILAFELRFFSIENQKKKNFLKLKVDFSQSLCKLAPCVIFFLFKILFRNNQKINKKRDADERKSNVDKTRDENREDARKRKRNQHRVTKERKNTGRDRKTQDGGGRDQEKPWKTKR
jgi:hypothetical protein